MVLDPLSAFSLACNVLQMIELGAKVLNRAADYRKAETGVLTEQKNLRDVLQSLNNLNSDLQSSLLQQTATKQHTVEEARLLEANDQCLRLSKGYIDFLERLRLRDGHAVVDSLRMSIKTLWHKDKMDAMEKSLSQARDSLNVAFLVYINSKMATQTAQHEILKNTTRIEGSILQAVASTSDLLQYDIKSLTEQLNNISLDSVQQIISRFTASHRGLLKGLTKQVDSILDLHNNFRALCDESQTAAARQSLLDSLHFPQIRERRDHIFETHNETYRWILKSKQGGSQQWDEFVSWLGVMPSEGRIYWIHGKIGAGKSTLLRFLDDNLSRTNHMLPWAQEAAVVRASYFFWNAGNKLQKSTTGLLRTLLTQLLEQTPDLIPRVVQLKKWQTARLAGNHVIEWTDSDLRDCLREYILYATKSRKVFLLVDGLDETEGTDEVREDLISLLVNLAANRNVKICLSSRPWNIFRDAFGSCPQLRLEDLTYNDISTYVHEQFYSNKRFQNLMQYDSITAEVLVTSLVSKASGVFLWVRLVTIQLLKGLRDGDGILTLIRRLEEMPPALDDYFMCLIESIAPQDRKEASKLLQLALYEEDEFTSLHSNCVLDFSFIEERSPDFVLNPFYRFSQLDFLDRDGMAFRLESTIRKLNSRCMGLLECYDQGGLCSNIVEVLEDNLGTSNTKEIGFLSRNKSYLTLDATKSLDNSQFLATANFTVDFLHRSLRDFLLTSKVQTLLHQYTQGPYDARMFFRSVRLVRLVALNKVKVDLHAEVGLASYILSTLTVPGYRDTPGAAAFASIMRPVVENLIQSERTKTFLGWYICGVFQCWRREGSTFLSLAIDFGLDSYVRLHLTPESVQSKKGRPILDYILRPRFVKRPSNLCVGNKWPDLELVNAVLRFGADPNQRFQGVSIWALFLCCIADQFAPGIRRVQNDALSEKAVYLEALKIMVQNGADMLLPRNWLSGECFGRDYFGEDPNERFSRRFPNITPILQRNNCDGTLYAVSDLLGCFCAIFEMSSDALKSLILL